MTTLNTTVTTLTAAMNNTNNAVFDTIPTMEENMMTNIQDLSFEQLMVSLNTEEATQERDAFLMQSVENALKEEAIKTRKALKGLMFRANGLVQAVRLLREVSKSKDLALQAQIIVAIIDYTKAWDYLVDTTRVGFISTPVAEGIEYKEGRKTYAEYYIDCIKYFLNGTKDSKLVKAYTNYLNDLQWGLDNIHAKFRTITDEEVAQFKSSEAKAHVMAKRFISLPVAPVTLEVRSTGLYMTAKTGVEFSYTGTTYVSVLTRNHSYLLTKEDISAGIFNLVNRIKLHTKTEEIVKGRKNTFMSTDSVEPCGSVINKIFLLKASKIDYSKLMETGKEGYLKVCSINAKGKVEVINTPTSHSALMHTYLETGIVGASEATAGYVAPLESVPGLLSVCQVGEHVRIYSIEEINKAMARHQKLNLSKGWSIGEIEIKVVFSTESYYSVVDNKIVVKPMDEETKAKAYKDFGPSTLIMTRELMERIGLCRITSPMSEGGLKTVTNFHKDFCDFNIVGPNAFKGGILAAANLMLNRQLTIDMLVGKARTLDMIILKTVSMLETINFNGYDVQVFSLKLKANISNPYTVESFKYVGEDLVNAQEQIDLQEEMDYVVSSANQKTSALRDTIMNKIVADPTFKAMKALMEMKANGMIIEKEVDTRLTASAYEPISLWNSPEAADALMDELLGNLTHTDAMAKKSGIRYLKGVETLQRNSIATVDALQIADLIMEMCSNISDNINTYPVELLEKVDNLLNNPTNCYGAKFVEINFNGTKVYLPALSTLFYTHCEIKSESNFLATSLLKDLLTHVKGFLRSGAHGAEVHVDSISGEGHKLNTKVQKALLGKNFGYLPARGTYLAAINPIGNYTTDVAEVRITNTQLMVDDNDNEVEELLTGKYPLYHSKTFAKVAMIRHTFGDALADMVFGKAAVVDADQMFSKIDDFDGDLRQYMVVSSATLDMFKLFDTCFDDALGAHFKKAAEKEGSTSIKTKVALQEFTTSDVQHAIINATTASKNIGLFTTVKYQVESVLAGVESFTSIDGKEYTLNGFSRNLINQVLAFLCQTESMDNMKQKGTSNDEKFISELIAPNRIAAIKGADEEDLMVNRLDYLMTIARRVNAVCEDCQFKVPTNFGMFFANAVFHVAFEVAAKGTRNLDLFRNTIVADRYMNEVAEGITEGKSQYDYNLTGSYSTLRGSADANSYVARLVRKFAGL